MRLAVLASHPVQYQAPILRRLAERADLVVFFGHRASADDQARAGFGVAFEWDVDLLAGYEHVFLENHAAEPGTAHFSGVDTPGIAKALADGRFDALLVLGWHLRCYWQGIFAARRLGILVLVRGDSHLDTPRGLGKRVLKAIGYPPALRVFDAALYVGERSRAYYENYRFPSQRLFFSPHCVDADWFAARATSAARAGLRASLGIAPDARVALFAGKLMALKRPLDLVDAAARAQAHGAAIEVMVAGAGALEDAVRARAAERGVRLHMLGFRNQSQMPAAFAAADVLALTSDRETWGLVANEALACGCPIVVTEACGCAPDLAGDGKVGRVVPVGDIARLAGAIQDLTRQPPPRSAMTETSRAYGVDAAVSGILRAADSTRKEARAA